MKRLILAISSFLYLSTAIGANLRFHYCMGELAGWGFGYNKDKVCGKCGMAKKAAEDNGCCRDEFELVKLKVDQKSPNTVVYKFQILETELLQPFIIFPIDLEKREASSSLPVHRPPRSSCTTIYMRNRNFRI
ncbi:MAG: HYC_CC_PP family protein [Chitinophagaceae bacterium]